MKARSTRTVNTKPAIEKQESIASIDEYIQQFKPEVQAMLHELRRTIKERAQGATEKISYRMPTFYLNGNLVHFAVFEKHIGFYPTPSAVAAFDHELTAYKRAKGSIQFPIDEPLPLKLIARMVDFRVAECTKHGAPGKKKASSMVSPDEDTDPRVRAALRVADRAEQVLAFFEDAHPQDKRPRQAIEAARTWARGEIPVGEARIAAFGAHAAARAVDEPDAKAAARAAGHAAATAHVAAHAFQAETYAAKAVVAHARASEVVIHVTQKTNKRRQDRRSPNLVTARRYLAALESGVVGQATPLLSSSRRIRPSCRPPAAPSVC
jgi:uncharacterized protein YdhG (YjbR/CyaY superfamily)